MQRSPSRLWLALLALGCGCSTAPLEPDFTPVEQVVSERTGQHVHWDQGLPEDEQARQAVQALLRQPLTPDTAVQVALLRNARLQATFEELSIAQADLVQAGALANPVLGVEYRGPGRPAWPLELHVIEDFMNVATRALRQRVAEADVDRARAHVTQAALELAADVRAAFIAVQAAQQVAELRATVVEATAASVEAAAGLVQAGNLPDLDLDRERALDGQARLDRALAEAELLERRERLTSLLGVWGDDTGWTIAERLPDPPATESSVEGLEALALEQRLDLAESRHAIEAAARRLGLTDATALIPSLEAGLHSEREPDGDTTIGPSLEIPVPIFDSGRARVARDQALLRQAQQEYRAQATEIRSEVRAASARMLASRTRAEYLREVLVPLRARVVEQTQLLYNGMQVGVFELLRSKQEEVDTGRESLEALADYWQARTGLERAVGGPLGAVVEAAGAPPPDVAPPGEPPPHPHGEHP